MHDSLGTPLASLTSRGPRGKKGGSGDPNHARTICNGQNHAHTKQPFVWCHKGEERVQIHNSRMMNQILPARRDIPRSLRGCTHLTYTYTNLYEEENWRSTSSPAVGGPPMSTFIHPVSHITFGDSSPLATSHKLAIKGQKVVLQNGSSYTCINHHHLNLPHSRDHRTIMTHVRLSQETPLHFS